MDNRTINIVSEGRDDLRAALSILFKTNIKATHYCEFRLVGAKPGETGYGIESSIFKEDSQGIPTLILSTAPIKGQGQKTMFPMDLDNSVDNAMGWLQNVDYPDEPGIDGGCKKGWRAFTESWGHVLGSHHAIVAIQPEWALYGK
ncbi:hypothetical protein IFT48_03305 [Pseudomonas fluorescens]|uniref:hypothetical protein n=1 Tax=Pseudomonas fluorescens TaxID=294 RepID=UPI001930E2A3|nr:hypothetical protein [Pseudomonas fluorescens]MBD8088996.1 hypothetical protein [Pseudomonas fluorescens]